MRAIEPFQMKKIFAIGNALGICGKGREDELHILIFGITGKESVKSLTYQEAAAVVSRLEELQGNDAAQKKPPKERRQKPETTHKERPGGVTAGQQKKIWALMYELQKYDGPDGAAPLGKRLCAVIKKELGIDAIAKNPFAWITFSQGNTLIEMLKRYVDSQKRKEAANHGAS